MRVDAGPRYLTERDIAAALDMHPEVLKRAIARQQLRAARSGRRGPYRVTPADIRRWYQTGAYPQRSTVLL